MPTALPIVTNHKSFDCNKCHTFYVENVIQQQNIRDIFGYSFTLIMCAKEHSSTCFLTKSILGI